jgi:Fe2+ or Zn2+ uptake regulation protein
MTDTAAQDELLIARLRERGLRVTAQRLVLHRAIRGMSEHATAEEILTTASPLLPNLSLPTVYSTLELLEELDLVRRAPGIGSGPVLYEPRPEPHGHFACRRCGRVEDLDADVDLGPAVAAAGAARMAPDGAEVVVTGLCAQCAAESAAVSSPTP